MDYNINLFNIIIGFAMFQSFIFGGLMFFKSSYKQAHKYLGITVIFLSFYLFWVLKYDFGFQKVMPSLRFLPVLFLWGIGPAFYAFLRMLFGSPIPSEKIKYHFIPLAIELIHYNTSTLIYFLNRGEWENLNFIEFAMLANLISVEHIVGLISIGIYLVLSIKLLNQQKKNTFPYRLKLIILSFSLLWVIWVPYTIYDIIYYNFAFPPSDFYVFYLLFAGLTYSVGFFGFKLNATIRKEVPINAKQQIKVQPDSELIKEAARIQKLMKEEKYYLEPNLNIRDFSSYVNLHPNKTSSVINTVLELSFRDFVNSYRIEEFKLRVASYNLEEKTILSLAFEVGFNSKASFNRVFKKLTDLSPVEYVATLKKSKSQNT